ncbi:MAG: hypothetical protein HY064_15795 [Bacteroidetes bacterium]|nr:hypothetical protein [Bacteroidota bacterium]
MPEENTETVSPENTESNPAAGESSGPTEKEKTPRVKPDKPVPPSIKVQEVYRMINGEWDEYSEKEILDKEGFFKVFHREFTSNGDLICEIQFDAQGNEVQKTQNALDEKGNIISHELFNEGQLAEKITFEYDDKGRVVKEQHEFEEGFPLTTHFIYDAEGRVIEKRADDNEGELQKKETFAYHPAWKDKIVKHEVFDEEGEKTLEEINEWEERDGEVKAKQMTVNDVAFHSYKRSEFYDPKTREDHIGFATFNEKDKVIEYVKVIFDEEGREAEEHSHSINDSDNFKVFYTYDEFDRVVKQEQHQEDKIISKITRRFNKSGHAELVAVRSFNRGVYVDWFEFEYFG